MGISTSLTTGVPKRGEQRHGGKCGQIRRELQRGGENSKNKNARKKIRIKRTKDLSRVFSSFLRKGKGLVKGQRRGSFFYGCRFPKSIKKEEGRKVNTTKEKKIKPSSRADEPKNPHIKKHKRCVQGWRCGQLRPEEGVFK